MSIDKKPIVDQWYRHLDKGQRFFVTAVDDDDSTVEIQHFDGDVEEFDLSEWYGLHVERIEQPEDWTGPVDIVERDDLGYTETVVTDEELMEAANEPPASCEPNEEEAEESEEER